MLQHIKLHHSSISNIKDFKQDTNSNDDQEILDEYSDNEGDYKIKLKNKRKSTVSNPEVCFFWYLVSLFIWT